MLLGCRALASSLIAVARIALIVFGFSHTLGLYAFTRRIVFGFSHTLGLYASTRRIVSGFSHTQQRK